MMVETVTLYFERKLSDGNYGSEGFSLGCTVSIADDEPFTEVVEKTEAMLRELVLERLAASANARVGFTANRELHWQQDQERAEAWANSNAASEDRAIRHMDDEEMPF